MTEFISRKYGAVCYEVIIKTTDREHYKASEEFARRLIDHAKPMTNGDRIRAMTDEELAALIEETSCCGKHCPAKEHCDSTETIGCFQTVLEWLRKPVEGDAE